MFQYDVTAGITRSEVIQRFVRLCGPPWWRTGKAGGGSFGVGGLTQDFFEGVGEVIAAFQWDDRDDRRLFPAFLLWIVEDTEAVLSILFSISYDVTQFLVHLEPVFEFEAFFSSMPCCGRLDFGSLHPAVENLPEISAEAYRVLFLALMPGFFWDIQTPNWVRDALTRASD